MMKSSTESSLLGVENELDLKSLLKNRFSCDNIHSFIDDILLSINPCKNLSSDDGKDNDLYEHVATTAIKHLRCHQQNQSIIVTGDSGSGKTTLSNQIVAFITKESTSTDHDLAQCVIQAGKVLESFGNACTARTDNASRFIKLTEMFFTEENYFKGVYFHHSLLEKSRVAQHKKGEKNFNIFYQFLGGTSQENLEKYHLSTPVSHRCIGNHADLQDEEHKYQEELNNVEENLKSLGFSQDNIDNIYRILAAIIHICDLTMTPNPKKKSVLINDANILLKASSLLQVTPERLQFALLTEMTSVKGRVVRRIRSLNEVENARDMSAMALYARLFAWIVWNINQYLAPIDRTSGNEVSILDPFGFERLDLNGVEQLIINTTNEHLKFLYNQIVFAWELADQDAEGILIQKVHFLDNKDTIDFLMERPEGIFALVEQETKSMKASDAGLVKKFSTKHRKHHCYSDITKSSFPAFAISHYNGQVTYSAVDILHKNKDMLGGSLITCLQESEDDLIHRLFMVKLSSTGAIVRAGQQSTQEIPSMPRKAEMKKMQRTVRRHVEMIGNIHGITNNKVAKKKMIEEQAHLTLTSRFRNSLSDLMQRNLKSELHFVICIRPNQALEPDQFDDDLVTAQLRYSGVMETVSMRQQGFPARIAFREFIKRYKILSFGLTMDVKYNQDTCEKILSHVDGLGWRIGKTKVFMKNSCREQLNDLIDAALRGIIIVQKLFRGRCARRFFRFLKHQQQKQKDEVISFITKIHSKMDQVYSNLCYQVNEEDVRVKCTDAAEPDEQVKKKALQILDGRKRNHKKQISSSMADKAEDTVDGRSDLRLVEELDVSSIGQRTSTSQSQPSRNEVDVNQNLEAETTSELEPPLVSMSDIFTSTEGKTVSSNAASEETSPFRSVSEDARDYTDDISITGQYSIMDVFSTVKPETFPDEEGEEIGNDTSIVDIMMQSSDDVVTPLASPSSFETSPVRPSLTGRESNLSTFSFDSILSPDGDLNDVAMESPGIWCVITCYERDISRGEFQVDRSVIIVDGSSNAFDVTRIGIGSLPMDPSDEKVEKTRRCIGKGIKLTIDAEGNMWVKRCSKNNVFVKGYFLSPEVKDSSGELPKGKLVKVFDYEAFSNNLQHECHPTRYDPVKCEELLSSTLVYFSFVKDAFEDVDTPCWIEVRMTEPYRITEVAMDLAKDRRRVERERRGEHTPPILRAKIGKSRQTIAVGAMEKKVRPQRYIDSFKYGRKGWARKKVSVNPFDFGNQAVFAADNTLRGRALSSPEELESHSEMDKAVSYEEVFSSKPSVTETTAPQGKVWAKDHVKAREEQAKGRIRHKTASDS